MNIWQMYLMLILLVMSFVGIVKIYSHIFKENIDVTSFEVASVFLILFLIAKNIIMKCDVWINIVFLTFLCFYLITTSYIDYKTKYVFTIFDRGAMGVGLLFLIMSNVDVMGKILNLCMFFFVILLYNRYEIHGEGDSDVLIVISIFISVFTDDIALIMMLILLMSTLLAILFNLKNMDFKKMRFKESIAFTPFITIVTIVLLVSYINC